MGNNKVEKELKDANKNLKKANKNLENATLSFGELMLEGF